MLLQRARNDADRRLIEFGYDPEQVEWFLSKTPIERLRIIDSWVAFVRKGRASIAAARAR
jgi:hypothetical protein